MEATTEVVSKDRISELPDSLIHHILSFLDIEFVKNTCMLSKRWRYLWLSLTTLRIDESYIDDDNNDFVTFNRFINFVDRLLLLRDTSSNIQTLELSWGNVTVYLDRLKLKYDVSSRLATWIMAAVKHNLEELLVDIYTDQMIKLPDCLFTHKSLTKLDFSGGGRDMTDFLLPNITMYSFPRLRYLALTGVSLIGDENLASKLLSSCPVLESLLLTDCSIKFGFTSLSLKHFELDNHDEYSSTDDYTNTVKLSAPNLTSMIFKDYMSQDYSLENLSSLVTADIGMRVKDSENYQPERPETYSELSTEVKKLYGARMFKFLRAVRNVTDLTLSSSPGFLEVLSQAPDLVDCQPSLFSNLQRLKLEMWSTRGCFQAMAYLLKISPNITHLLVEYNEPSVGNIGDGWEAGLSLPTTMLSHLKFVQIKQVKGRAAEFKLLSFLLKNAMVLEKVMLCPRSTVKSSDTVRMKFIDKLRTLPRASSHISMGWPGTESISI